MPALPAKHYAAELQRQLRSLLGHEQIITQAYGRHLLIKRLDDEEPTVVARLTELGRIVMAPPFEAIADVGNFSQASVRSTKWPRWLSCCCSLRGQFKNPVRGLFTSSANCYPWAPEQQKARDGSADH